MLTPEVRKNHGPRSSCGKTLNLEPNFWHWSILLTHKKGKVSETFIDGCGFLSGREVAWDFRMNFALIWRPSEFLFCIPYILWKKWICLRQVGNKSLEQFCNHLELSLLDILFGQMDNLMVLCLLDNKQNLRNMVHHQCRIQIQCKTSQLDSQNRHHGQHTPWKEEDRDNHLVHHHKDLHWSLKRSVLRMNFILWK